MGCKFSFKRVFLVASLCLAGLFGVSATLVNNQVSSSSNVQNAVAASQSHDDPGNVLWQKEKVGDNWYRVFYYIHGSTWEMSSDSNFTSNHNYQYKISGDDTIYPTTAANSVFGAGAAGTSDCYSEIAGYLIAKIFLPVNATEIRFRSRTSTSDVRAMTEFMTLGNNDAFVITADNWDRGTNATGEIMTYSTFISNWAKIIHYTVVSPWDDGNGNLGGDRKQIFINCTRVKKDGSTENTGDKYITASSSMIIDNNGMKYVRVIVRNGTSIKLNSSCFQINGANRNQGKSRNITPSEFPSDDYPVFFINTNNWNDLWDVGRQDGWWGTFHDQIHVDVDLNSVFSTYGAGPYIRYWDGSNNVYLPLNYIDNNIYCSAVPKVDVLGTAKRGFEVYCWSHPDTDGNDCTKWIPGADSPLQYNNYNYVCLASGRSGSDARVPLLGYGYYGSEISNPDSPTPDTQRIWLKNDNPHGFYNNDDWGTGCKNVIGYTYQDKWYTIEMLAVNSKTTEGNDNYYYYADIPTSVTDFHFFRMSRNASHKFLAYLDAYVDFVTFVYGKLYFAGTYSYDDFKNINCDSVAGTVREELLVEVLKAYYTCKTDAVNGCDSTTISHIKDVWIGNNNERLYDPVNFDWSTTFLDYPSMDTEYIGSRTYEVTLRHKWTAMETGRYRPSLLLGWFNLVESSNEIASTVIIVVISSLSLLSITALSILLVKKRKIKETN